VEKEQLPVIISFSKVALRGTIKGCTKLSSLSMFKVVKKLKKYSLKSGKIQ